MMMRTYVGCVTITIVALGLAGCAHSGKRHKEEVSPVSAPVQRSAKDYETDLRNLVKSRVEAVAKAGDEQRNRIVKREPYFYREHEVYPEGADNLTVLMQEKESRSVPYVADVTLPKQRFATKFHRKRREAEADVYFLRDSGTETITFELRNGKWTRVGSIFVAEKTEENVNGEWLPVKETATRTVAAEEERAKGGWFKRTWSKITGRSEEEKEAKGTKEEKPKRGSAPGSSQSPQRLRSLRRF